VVPDPFAPGNRRTTIGENGIESKTGAFRRKKEEGGGRKEERGGRREKGERRREEGGRRKNDLS